MKNNNLMEIPLKSSGENGIFNKYHWIKEADGKLISAKLLRECAINKQLEFDTLKAKKKIDGEKLTSKDVFEILNTKESANKSSVLILGYALELLLKSGVVSLLINAPKKLLEKKVRSYSHNLLNLVLDLHFPLSCKERDLLEVLSSYIIRETRYPVTPSTINDYCKQVNQITNFISSEAQFMMGVKLFERLRCFVSDIDGTEDNIKIHSRMEMEGNGYITFRVGGRLPPVFIIKFCQSQIDAEIANIETVKALIIEKNKVNKSIDSNLMEKNWGNAIFYIVDDTKGLISHCN
ncbi:hypothetical protein Q4Q49_02415 [Shewanella sp. SP1S1-7]|uniref:hypothetical protein n=1 Tax=Shewanella sp. SP1S1-7 TaxID=3063536 RepID=UPI00288E0CCC|nr:hypothetical protein [Shewanella sp. SP1S1-7]MDT3334137.1 hypothetical protein [Shewanella sp. SP1S1-7]